MNTELPGLEPNPAGHPSRLALARLLAGDFDGPARMALETHIGSCLHCSGVFENAKLDAADFARRRPTLESLAPKTRRPASPAPVPGWGRRLRDLFDRATGLRPALAGFALLALASVIWMTKGGWNGPGPGDLAAKGEPRFQAYLNGKLAIGDTLACAPMDTLQLMILSETPVHYAVLYRDDGGPLTPYMAGADNGDLPLGTLRGEALPHSLVLGTGWAREILFCIWSSRSFTLIEAETAAEADGSAGSVPVGLHVQIIPLANRSP